MRFKALPVTSLEDATVDFEQLQAQGVDRINSTLVPLKGVAWIAPTLINSWANVGGGASTAGYFKDPLGFVHCRGRVMSGANSSNIFVFPAGFRPGQGNYYPLGGTATSVITSLIAFVDPTGFVQFASANAGAGTDVSLAGISFLAEG